MSSDSDSLTAKESQMTEEGPNEVGTLLEASLELAVPLWIWRIRAEKWSAEKRLERARACGVVVAEKGDVLQFGGKKGGAAHAFNHLAEGLACLAFSPGGVKFQGLHFEADDGQS